MKGYDREEAVRSIVGAIDQKAYSDLGMSVEALVRQACRDSIIINRWNRKNLKS